uniref:Reverse transcriptase zinc-binding domain-containing protein n=1 Tax=Triticum urartu TaxID=4572 RepID=A0A8R7UJJ4_TRIUA
MYLDRKEWDVGLIREIFHSFDADDICRISIPRLNVKDCIAWHPEKNGIFSVRSAYKLAAAIKHKSVLEPSSSTNNPDNRSIWDLIWKADVPPKVRIFGWRVATNTLATKKNKFRRTITLDATCDICECGDENEFHAVVSCTKSRALRHKMREEWDLPAEKQFWNTGEDWLQ